MGSILRGLRQVVPSKAFWGVFALMLVVHQVSMSARKGASLHAAGARGLTAYNGTDPDPNDPTPCEIWDVEAHHPDECAYVKANCPPESLIDYYGSYFCAFANVHWLTYVLLFGWLGAIFVWLGTVADDFFVQNLRTISNLLKMSQNMAGVTFLAIGNGAPDLFGSFAAIASDTPMLALGQLLGAGVFVTTVVVAVIGFQMPFRVNRRPFLRDVLFYLGGVTYILSLILTGGVTVITASLFIAFYALYISVVFIGRRIYQAQKRKAILLAAAADDDETSAIAAAVDPRLADLSLSRDLRDSNPAVNAIAVEADQKSHHLHRAREEEPLLGQQTPFVERRGAPDDDDDDEYDDAPVTMFDIMFPIVRRWPNLSLFQRVTGTIAAPLVFFLSITIPVVNPSRPNGGWNRPTATLQMFVMPIWAIVATQTAFITIGANEVFTVWMGTLICSFTLSALVFFLSKDDEAPAFYKFFAFAGFITAALWIYTISGELVGVLLTIGRLFNISDTLLGLTVLAWGNSLGDLVSNPAIARKGYPGIGVSACFGGPLLNLLLGLGIAFTARTLTYSGDIYPLHWERNLYVLFPGIYGSLIMSLIVIPVSGFAAGRKYAMVLAAFYVVFLVTNIAVEMTA